MTHEEGFREAQYRVDNFTGGELFLNDLNLTKLPDMTHISNMKFLNVSNNELTCLKGSPAKVEFYCCQRNKLTSLKYSPTCFMMYCSNNNLKNLEYYKCVGDIDYDIYDDNHILKNHLNLLKYYNLDYYSIHVWRYYENYFNS